jgi:hypothetical protein
VGDEYFLVENRQQIGYDIELPGEGLLIYHVSDTVSTQNDNEWYPGHTEEGHYLVALEQADGQWQLEQNTNQGEAGDPFPGSTNNTAFEESTTPDSKTYSFASSAVEVTNISPPGTYMTADLTVEKPCDTLWTNTFGGIEDDIALSVQQTSDGGFIMSGRTFSFGAGMADAYLVKTDASGTEQWSQTYGDSMYDRGPSVQQTSDGGYVIAGQTWSYGAGQYDVYLVKTGASGSEQWYQTFGDSLYDIGYSVQLTSDGGYIIAGKTQSYGAGGYDVYLIKTGASGSEQWSQTFGGSSDEEGWSVQQTSDGGYIIAGSTESYGAGGYDIYLIKTDATGTEQWSQTFGGSGTDRCFSVQQTTDGGYIIAGPTTSYGAGSEDAYLIKTDASGDTLWTKTFGGSGSDLSKSVKQTSDGEYIVAGRTDSFGAGNYDIWLIKTNASGTEQWSQTFGGSSFENGYSVQQTSDGGYIIAGTTESYGAGGEDIYLIRMDSETLLVEDFGTYRPREFAIDSPFPNPFNPRAVLRYKLQTASLVELSVYDITGRLVTKLVDGWRKAGSHQVTLDATGFASGVYIYSFRAGEFKDAGKMVLMK